MPDARKGLFVNFFLFRCRRRDEKPDLLPRWKAFIESNPVIPPARVPPLKPLAGVKVDEVIERRCGEWVKFQRRA